MLICCMQFFLFDIDVKDNYKTGQNIQLNLTKETDAYKHSTIKYLKPKVTFLFELMNISLLFFLF